MNVWSLQRSQQRHLELGMPRLPFVPAQDTSLCQQPRLVEARCWFSLQGPAEVQQGGPLPWAEKTSQRFWLIISMATLSVFLAVLRYCGTLLSSWNKQFQLQPVPVDKSVHTVHNCPLWNQPDRVESPALKGYRLPSRRLSTRSCMKSV